MERRLELQATLEALCPNVYFQAPENLRMSYPAITYERGRGDVRHANNLPYKSTDQYTLTLISRDPDEPIRKLLERLSQCVHERFFVADNLNHDVFNIYF